MILLYHKVDIESKTMWWVDVENFYRQKHEISSKNVDYLDDYDRNNPSHISITFDGVYENIYQYALPILKKFNYPFELFISGNLIGKSNDFDSAEPDSPFANISSLKKLVQEGGRLQWHTNDHLDLTKQSIEIIKNELRVPNKLKDLNKSGFNWFAYPYGRFNEDVIESTKLCFKGGLACDNGDLNNDYKMIRKTIKNDTSLKEKTISCIIPVYNYGKYLQEAIESVINQSILPDEIIIADDCSEDSTKDIATAFSNKYPELISYIRNEKNLGPIDNFNNALLRSNSDYYFLLGADNALQANYIEKLSSFANKLTGIGIFYTDYALFGPLAALKYEKNLESRKKGIINDKYYLISFEEPDNPLEHIQKMNFIHGSSLISKKAYTEAGGYKSTKRPEDYSLFMKIIENGWGIKKVEGTYLRYRQHSTNQLNNSIQIQKELIFWKNEYHRIDNHKTFHKSKIYKIVKKLYYLFNKLKK